MKRLALAAIAVFVVSTAVSIAAQAKDLTGKWNATFTATLPDGRSQSITYMFDLTQKGKVLTGKAGPTPERQWNIEKGTVEGNKVTFQVLQTDNGVHRTFTLTLTNDILEGPQTVSRDGQELGMKVTVKAERSKQ